MRFRVTVRDASIELRGYVDGEDVLRTLADDIAPTMVIASPAEDDYDPFKEAERRELHHFETEEILAKVRELVRPPHTGDLSQAIWRIVEDRS